MDLDGDFDFGETAGGIEVGSLGGTNGVAGERWVASTLGFERRDCREENEPREDTRSMSLILGLFPAAEDEGLLCGNRDDCSVAGSPSSDSSTIIASSSSPLLGLASESTNPL